MLEGPYDPQRIAVISHADGGYNRKHGLAPIAQAAQDLGLAHYPIHNSAEMDAALEHCARRNPGLLILNAGDGTVCAIVQRLRESVVFADEPRLALLRGGTTNMIHRDVGCKGRPAPALRTLAASLQNGSYRLIERCPMRVRIPDTIARYGFFFATNAMVRAILHTRRHLHRRGATGWVSEALSITVMLSKLLRRRIDDDPVLAPVSIELKVDDQDWRSQQQIFLLAFTLRRLILGLRPLPQQQSAGLAVLASPGYRLGRWLRRFQSGQVEKFTSLALRGGFSWVLDGEIYEQQQEDGALMIDIAAPVAFLVDTKGR